jgi:hypothetical protein
MKLPEQFVIFAKVAVPDVGIARLALLLPSLAFADRSWPHLRPAGLLIEDEEIQMQAHGVIVVPGLAPAVGGPSHPGQGPEERAISGHPSPSLQVLIPELMARHFLDQLAENLLQQRRVDHMLGLRKTSQADGPSANLPLHPRQEARLASPAHRPHDRIEQGKKIKRQIVSQPGAPPRVREGRVHLFPKEHFVQHALKARERPPIGQILLRQRLTFSRGGPHRAIEPNRTKMYKLQLRDNDATHR